MSTQDKKYQDGFVIQQKEDNMIQNQRQATKFAFD